MLVDKERRRVVDYARSRLRANYTGQLTDEQVIELRRLKMQNNRTLDRMAALDDAIIQLMREIDKRSEQIIELDAELSELRKSLYAHAEFGRMFNVHVKTIDHILSGRTYRHLPTVDELDKIEE